MNGKDPVGSPSAYINDPDYTFKTLQKAIDVVHERLRTDYHATNNPDQQAIVWAMPGLYGPWGGNSSGDPLSIYIRDRVHVQGVGARRCVLRVVGQGTHPGLFWPNVQDGTSLPSFDPEVLVTWESAHPTSLGPPLGPHASNPAPWLVVSERIVILRGNLQAEFR